jgi:hypothetical protein
MASPESSMVSAESSMVAGREDAAPGRSEDGEPVGIRSGRDLLSALPDDLRRLVTGLGMHVDEGTMRGLLRRLCSVRAYRAEELALLVKRTPDYIKTRYLRPMLAAGELQYTIPDMPRHPNQAYVAAQPPETQR